MIPTPSSSPTKDHLLGTTVTAQPPHVDISERILTVSTTMVGVCLTVIGLVRFADELGKVRSVADNIVAIDAVAFLAATLLAYGAIRSNAPSRKRFLEQLAEILFLAALVGMVVVCGLIAYEIV